MGRLRNSEPPDTSVGPSEAVVSSDSPYDSVEERDPLRMRRRQSEINMVAHSMVNSIMSGVGKDKPVADM